MAILGADGKPAVQQKQPGVGMTVPPVNVAEEMLNAYMGQLMLLFRNNGVDGFTINALGRIMASLKFDDKERQTPAEIMLKVHEEAIKYCDDMKMWLLKQSVANTDPKDLS